VHVDVVVAGVGQDVGHHGVAQRELRRAQARVQAVGRLAVLRPGQIGHYRAVLARLALVDVRGAAIARGQFQLGDALDLQVVAKHLRVVGGAHRIDGEDVELAAAVGVADDGVVAAGVDFLAAVEIGRQQAVEVAGHGQRGDDGQGDEAKAAKFLHGVSSAV